jgi:hypothetical protein
MGHRRGRLGAGASPPAPLYATVTVALPVPMRQQLEEAAIDCRSVTFHNGASRTQEIKRVAFEVGGQFRRTVTIEINSRDVVVSFILSAA